MKLASVFSFHALSLFTPATQFQFILNIALGEVNELERCKHNPKMRKLHMVGLKRNALPRSLLSFVRRLLDQRLCLSLLLK